jgi:hypothetical protein
LKSLLQDFVEIQHEVVQVFVEGKTREAPNLQQKLLDSSSKAVEQQLAKLMGSTSPSCLPLRVPPFQS